MASASNLAPGFLLAAPSLRDPNFRKTVVLLGRHDDEGALGWIVNGRAIADVVELFKTSGLFPEGTRFPKRPGFARSASQGGPVAPATGWLIFKPSNEELPGQLDLADELAVTGEASAFPVFTGEGGPGDFRLVLG
ncbi:MAG TPA: YqgE/AlgH family protein, partial [Polyangia bacterium]